MSNPYDTLNAPAPIKANLWHTMNVAELQDQRLLLSDRFNTLTLMVDGADTAPAIVGMLTALGHSLQHIDQIISTKQNDQRV